jgi:exosortase
MGTQPEEHAALTSIEPERLPAERAAAWSPTWPRARAVALAMAAVGGAIAFRDLAQLETPRGPGLSGAEAFMFSPSGGSPAMIYAGTAWLLARRWDRIRAAIGQPPKRVAGAALLALGAATCLWSGYTSHLPLLLPALSCALLGSALWLGGVAAARAVLLPAVFLLLATPVPSVLLNAILYPVQLATVKGTTWLLNSAGLGPALSSGDRIFRDGAVFEVIESCSGVRTVETILMTAFLYHDLFFRSRLQSALIIVGAPLIGLVANQIRVLGIVLNPYSKFAAVHTAQGLVMIFLAVLMLAAFDAALTRLLPRVPRRRRRGTPHAVPLPRAVALAVALAGLAALTLVLPAWLPAPTSLPPLSKLPPELDGWRASGLKLDDQFLGSVTFSEWVYRRYERADQHVDVLIGSDDRLDPRIDFESPKASIPGSGWEIEPDGAVELGASRTARRYLADFQGSRQLVYVWTEGTSPRLEELVRSVLATDRSPLRRTGRGLLVRLATPIGTEPRAVAEERLRGFASVFDAALPRTSAPSATPATAQ